MGKKGCREMTALLRHGGLGAMVLALFMAVPASAQDNLDADKSPAQLYAQDCAICHKTPHGLSKAGGRWGLQNFLREHYTASRESAAAIAAYLAGIDRKSPASARSSHRSHKSEKSKAGAKLPPHKPGAKAEVKPVGTPDEAKAKSESKPESKSETKAEPDQAKTVAKGSKDAKDGKPEKKSD
jgi:hypothetical protein